MRNLVSNIVIFGLIVAAVARQCCLNGESIDVHGHCAMEGFTEPFCRSAHVEKLEKLICSSNADCAYLNGGYTCQALGYVDVSICLPPVF